MRRTRHTRQLPRADMTPLVNIALLLIVFFVYVKQVQRSNQMVMVLPDRGSCVWETVYPTASVFLLENNRVGLLTYLPDSASAEFKEIDYSTDGLRVHLAEMAKSTTRPIVIIVPTAQSSLKNMVDVLDELTINGRVHHTMTYEPLPGEKRLLAAYQHYKQSKPTKPFSMHLPIYTYSPYTISRL